jgi:hypothetical protein
MGLERDPQPSPSAAQQASDASKKLTRSDGGPLETESLPERGEAAEDGAAALIVAL